MHCRRAIHVQQVVALGAALVVALSAGVLPASSRTLNVALHAQSRYAEHGWVAGSEVTTAGLSAAFKAYQHDLQGNSRDENANANDNDDNDVNNFNHNLYGEDAEPLSIGRVHVFAPFSYEGLLDSNVPWDLVIIEGWSGAVPRFIDRVRRHSPEVVVIHYCLDTYPSLDHISVLDVDGLMTNSERLAAESQERLGLSAAQVRTILLAADPLQMQPVPVQARYEHDVVYLGQYATTKHQLLPMLEQVQALGVDLAIYGSAWDRYDGPLREHWRGILPLGDIAALYSSARVVLGTTETKQRNLGMINNRVFEALACGAAFVSDHFPELEAVFGDTMLYAREPSDAARHVQWLLAHEDERAQLRRRGREHIVAEHTYGHRVGEMVRFWMQLDALRGPDARDPPRRPNLPLAAVVHSGNGDQARLVATLLEARFSVQIVQVRKSAKHNNIPPRNTSMARELLLGSVNKLTQVVVAVGPCRGLADLTVQRAYSSVAHAQGGRQEPWERVLEPLIFGMVVPGVVGSQDEADGDKEDGEEKEEDDGLCEIGSLYDAVLLIPTVNEDQSVRHPVVNAQAHVVVACGSSPCAPVDSARFVDALWECRFESVCLNAGVRVEWPRAGATLTSDALSSVPVRVRLDRFVCPDDGMWCVRVNGREVRCVGDSGVFEADVNLDADFAALSAAAAAADGSANDGELWMEFSAVLRTLIDREVVRESTPVRVKVVLPSSGAGAVGGNGGDDNGGDVQECQEGNE